MVELSVERQSWVGIIGTMVATLAGPVPPQETLVIYRTNYANPTNGTVMAYLMQAPANTGYSTMGTISPSGSIVDFWLLAAGANSDPPNGDEVIAVVPPGSYLVGVATAGSVIVSVVGQYRLGRSA